MSYPINTKITPYAQPLTGSSQMAFPAVDKDKIKQDINNTPVAKVATSAIDSPGVLLGLMVPIWIGISKAMDKFNAACADKVDGSKNILKKIGDFGDKVGEKLGLKPMAESKNTGFIANAKKFINTQFIDKSAILRAAFRTPSVPTNKMAITQSLGTIGEVANDGATMIGKYTNNGKDLQKVAELGFKDYAKVIDSPSEHIDEIIKACRKKGVQESVDMAKKGSFQPIRDFFGRKIYWSELGNKLEALKGLESPNQVNALGKALPKGTIRVLESLTNGAAGGKLAILMQAYILADAVVRTIKAPKGEKGKTFAENVIYNAGWYLAMPLSLNLMHNVGGLQYLGMKGGEATATDVKKVSFKAAKKAFKTSGNQAEFDAALKGINDKAADSLKNFRQEASVKNYRAAVNAFNEKVASGAVTDKAEYDTIIKEFKAAFKAKGAVKWYQKPFKTIGKIMTTGLEHYRAFTNQTDSKFVKALKNTKFNVKNSSGSILRVVMFMAVIAPFFGKLAAKASHLVFGKPTKSVLDEEITEEAPKPAGGQTLPTVNGAVTQPTAVAPTAPVQPQAQQSASPVQLTPGGGLLNSYKAAQSAAPQVTAPQLKTQEPVRSYIPSSAPVQIQGISTDKSDKVNVAMNKANAAEQEALKYLAGK